MYIVTLEDHPDGVYSVFDEQEDRVIPIFQEEDDADRYLMMLEIYCLYLGKQWDRQKNGYRSIDGVLTEWQT